ncbi:hypothetical protein TrLO_g7630 [Triparma laevis f. longispina]|uniref:Uncharacterized protein n=1 Tax=Triparma laevis f. longispina TaxID=1714387 RepID=A0A9W7FK10_9STRA|nr:hypothetical protein TrLO_g7630 [Triparma laevis f. longispina]
MATRMRHVWLIVAIFSVVMADDTLSPSPAPTVDDDSPWDPLGWGTPPIDFYGDCPLEDCPGWLKTIVDSVVFKWFGFILLVCFGFPLVTLGISLKLVDVVLRVHVLFKRCIRRNQLAKGKLIIDGCVTIYGNPWRYYSSYWFGIGTALDSPTRILAKHLHYDKFVELKRKVTELSFVPNIKKNGHGVCYLCELLVNVSIPEGIDEISESSFWGCTGLLNVKFPKSLKKIDNGAFKECTSVESLDLSHTLLESIGGSAFEKCSALKSLRLNSVVKPPGTNAFQGCFKLAPSTIYNEDSGCDATPDIFTYLQWKSSPLLSNCIDNNISALEAILNENPQVLLERGGGSNESALQYAFNSPCLTKLIVLKIPDATIDSKTYVEYAKEVNAPQLTTNMLELITLDELKACGGTNADIQAAVDDKKATMNELIAAMGNIVDYAARENATVLQTKMFGELKIADVSAAKVTFGELKAFCGDQAKRLGDLISVVMNKYKTLDFRRYEPFEQVSDITVKEQRPPPSALKIEEQVKFQLSNASWYEEEFQAAMNKIANFFNRARTCQEICEHYGIDNTDGRWSKELRAEAYNLDVNTDEVVRAKFGPPKGFPRALEKMKQGKTLRDLNRVTLEFEDPLLMALCFEVLNKKYNIHGLKNKYLQETFKEPPNLHMNLDIKDGWLCEVQMLFRDILLVKKELHKFYDVNRADGPFVVAGKLFKSEKEGQERTYKSAEMKKVVKAKDSEIAELKNKVISQSSKIKRLEKTIKEKGGETAANPLHRDMEKEEKEEKEEGEGKGYGNLEIV